MPATGGALPLTSTDATNVADAVDEGRTAARDDEQEVVQYNCSQFHASSMVRTKTDQLAFDSTC